ncbi:uncharacterized protein DS421_15g508560 [Arachis hypogaea]|nr:uncharacterized protein DS421_15g508560 [Arachis hypogaea]
MIHDEGSLSDLPSSSRPPITTATFTLHRRFLFNGIKGSKSYRSQISDLRSRSCFS